MWSFARIKFHSVATPSDNYRSNVPFMCLLCSLLFFDYNASSHRLDEKKFELINVSIRRDWLTLCLPLWHNRAWNNRKSFFWLAPNGRNKKAQNTILPEAVQFWEQALMVRETKGVIRLNR